MLSTPMTAVTKVSKSLVPKVTAAAKGLVRNLSRVGRKSAFSAERTGHFSADPK